MQSYFEISENLFSQLKMRSKEVGEPQKFAEIAVKEISSSLYILRERVRNVGFESEKDEIQFFKSIKPGLISNLTYYQFVYELESQKHVLSAKKLKCLVKNRKNAILNVINEDREFLNYFRNNCTYLDHHYFTRNGIECKPCALKIPSLIDPGFSTSHDFMVAKIMTFDLLTTRFTEQSFTQISSLNVSEKSTITFTDRNISIIELAYALYYSGSIDNGAADIREICEQLGKAFNIEVNDFYRSFLDIKSRKGSKTKYLDKLVKVTNTAIYNLDEN